MHLERNGDTFYQIEGGCEIQPQYGTHPLYEVRHKQQLVSNCSVLINMKAEGYTSTGKMPVNLRMSLKFFAVPTLGSNLATKHLLASSTTCKTE